MSQIKTFLENDPHSREILHLVDALGLAFEKISPVLSEETGAAFGRFMLGVQKDLKPYLEEHIRETVKEITGARNN